ncbi:MAG: hypothetical protein B1H08_00235 [Candidatus Omnitrophica bacterium 4484_171]|nr:MAG: hypothetical protein B1H08_00235 [Candidatus Omnitrophica bacterium 4484_171]
MKKRRKFIRFNVPLRVELSAKGNIALSSRGQALDFSREGLRVSIPSNDSIPDNSVELKVFLPNRYSPVLIHGKIIWISSGDRDVEMGLKIKEIDASGKAEILDYIYKVWKDKKSNGRKR